MMTHQMNRRTGRRTGRRATHLPAARILCVWAIVVAAGGSTPANSAEQVDELVTVRLAGGRSFTAAIDPRSDSTKLWLRFSADSTTILRPIAWTAVVAATAEGRDLTVDDLRRRAEAARAAVTTPGPAAAPAAKPMPRVLVTRGAPAEPIRQAGGVRPWNVPSAGIVPAAYYTPGPRVVSIAIDAQMVGWDADVEADGLLVEVTPIGDDGASLPVDGSVEIELVGPALPPLSRGNAFGVLARWTRQLRADDLAAAAGTYRLRLPFQGYHPEYEFNPSRHGLVHVRLLAPGHGSFEASADAVTLRGFTPVRERMEQAFGTRFLPTERTLYGKPQVNMGP
jgi:hypothetical protein